MSTNRASPKPDSSEGRRDSIKKEDSEEKGKTIVNSAKKESAEIEDIFGELKMLGKLPLSSTGSMDQEEDTMGCVKISFDKSESKSKV